MNEVLEKRHLALLVCFAVREEATPGLPLPPVSGGREALITGMGRRNASTRFLQALTRLSPDRVITCGFAGALNREFEIGDVLFDEDFDAGFGETLRSLGAMPAKFHCSTRVAVTIAEKAELRRLTNADAVEMESEAIQTVCRARGIPCATARAISDAAGEDLPLDFNRLSKADANLDYARLAWTIAKSPGKIPALRRLQKRTRRAAEELGKVLAEVV